MNVARISYTNTAPFFHFWETDQFPLTSGVPRALARAAKDGDVVAGPLPVVECWNLEQEFMPLGNWGIAALQKCRSVFVFSNRPFKELDRITIGVTRESSTSVALCSLLIHEKYGHRVRLRRGLETTDEAWLVIGDQALQMGYSPASLTRWTYVTDLATEWWDWQGLPFVFAQWVVNRKMDPVVRGRLARHLQYSFHRGMASLHEIAEKQSERLHLQPELLSEYLKGFMYQFSSEAEYSMRKFKQMVQESEIDLTPAGRI